MLKTRHDDALDESEWQEFLVTQDFGQIVAPGLERAFPMIVPTHYRFDGVSLIELHLHRRNPLWQALRERPTAAFTVIGAHVFIPSTWNVERERPVEWAAPTSYYATVQALCKAVVVDDPQEIAGVLQRQMAQMQPEGGYASIVPGENPYGRCSTRSAHSSCRSSMYGRSSSSGATERPTTKQVSRGD
ncbi:MAG: FMN-binding negative transcriptional regulator [Actinomycetota bacterium]